MGPVITGVACLWLFLLYCVYRDTYDFRGALWFMVAASLLLVGAVCVLGMLFTAQWPWQWF